MSRSAARLWASLALAAFLTTAVAVQPTRILCIGDSNTEGIGQAYGYTFPKPYRFYLWQKLNEEGYTVDFVGTKAGILDISRTEMQRLPEDCGDWYGPEFLAWDDAEHCGQAAWTSSDILNSRCVDWREGENPPTEAIPAGEEYYCQSSPDGNKLAVWLDQLVESNACPDIALVMLGTNDVANGITSTAVCQNITTLLSLLRGANPNMIVVVAKVPPRFDGNGAYSAGITALNTAIGAMIPTWTTNASPVLCVDMHTSFTADDLFAADLVHLNDIGAGKAADKWYDAISDFVNAFRMDIQGDGCDDYVQIHNHQCRIRRGSPNGVFAAAETFFPWDDPAYGIGADNTQYKKGDFDGDGKDDLIHLINVPPYADWSVVWYGTSQGDFDCRGFQPFGGGYWIGSGDNYYAGHFDSDNRSDLIHMVPGTDYVQIWSGLLQRGSFYMSGFSPWPGYAVGYGSYRVGNWDGQYADDLAHFVNGSFVNIWRNNGCNYWYVDAYAPSWDMPIGPADEYEVGDVNADGRDDLRHGTNGAVWHGRPNMISEPWFGQ